MWNYEKRLQYPVNIKTPNAKLAQFIMSQYGGPDGEIGASMRYLSQRFTAPNRMAAAVLNDVATEELAHLEMVSTIVHQLTRNLSMEEIENSGLGPYYIDHTVGVWPQAAGGVPFNACEFQSNTEQDERGLLPYPVIIAATKGDPEAMKIVVQHYESYIASLSMRKLIDERGNTYYGIDEDIRDRLRSKLMRAVLSFKV